MEIKIRQWTYKPSTDYTEVEVAVVKKITPDVNKSTIYELRVKGQFSTVNEALLSSVKDKLSAII